ncbi:MULTISPECIES: PaaX family transcriptional regulator C-terminal domain-containing protein [Streptomyces]|uniref:PaaX family transcriptional regulator C-terminal domain-containing protein n=1 Tax=Streptomyces TaxID=1883 RepID=UPI00224921EE|nr:PaaX family transcriptional regulator C-terminal domain-containing protein [Streptomyces sp. JHD 1]MCX2967282.1 transcriptional regulator [Streptomyces sp. JHD 1]
MTLPPPADDRPVAPRVPTRTLVHALVREDGTVDTGELYDTAAALAMTDQQVRLCVKRLVAEGRFTHQGRGRRGLLTAARDAAGWHTPEVEFVRHAYRQDAGEAPWDGGWHLFAFAVPESARQARDRLRQSLLYLGAAGLHGGLYVSANAIADRVRAHARAHGAEGTLTHCTTRDLRVADVDAPRELAARLWPLDAVAARYDRLAALAQAHLDRLAGAAALSPATLAARALEVATAFTEAMEPDPLLPPELLPRPWAGAHARQLAAACWAALLAHPAAHPGPRGLPRLFRLYADAVPRQP